MAIIDGKIRCYDCGEAKPLDVYAPSMVAVGNGACQPCMRKQAARYQEQNREKYRETARRWYARNKELHRARMRRWAVDNQDVVIGNHLKRTYGISLDEYDRILAAQGGGCAICGKRQGVEKLRLGVDHDHITGAVRGILCHRCNRAMASLGDCIAGVRRVLAYLERAQDAPPTPPPRAPAMRINLLTRGARS